MLGDSLGAGIVEHLSRRELQSQECDPSVSLMEEHEKPSHLLCLKDDGVNPHDIEAPHVTS